MKPNIGKYSHQRDLFKPLYKRDKHLSSSNDCTNIIDLNKILARYMTYVNESENVGYFSSEKIKFKSNEYTICISKELLTTEEAINDDLKYTEDMEYEINSPQDAFRDYFLRSKYSQNSYLLEQKIKLNQYTLKITIEELPGLVIFPSIIPPEIQCLIIEELIEELIPDTQHRNNLDIHYEMDTGLVLFPEISPVDNKWKAKDENEFKSSKFQCDPNNIFLKPLEAPLDMGVSPIYRYEGINLNNDDCVVPKLKDNGDMMMYHKPVATRQAAPVSLRSVRSKRLRWVTLGGQYNWTTKKYPSFNVGDPMCPPFPQRLGLLFSRPIFDLVPEAAIVNFYSPGDILSPHQDVAEISTADLVSLSLGCEAVFYVGLDRYGEIAGTTSDDTKDKCSVTKPPLQILLKSGDAIVMGGKARHAYHGVGKVWADTCPDYLKNLENNPLLGCLNNDETIEKWKLYSEWISTKRININVRQMLHH